ncbi:MAG: ferrous iron transport protein B, partial [Pygmaiobacter sp.]
RLDFCTGAVHRAIHSIAHMIEDHALRAGVPMRFAATKLLEGDEPMLERLQLSENEQEMLCHTVSEMEQELSTDRAAAMADMRYTFIERICAGTVVKTGASREHERSVRIDRILTHRYLGIPVFLLIMGLVFWLTFGVLGAALSTVLEVGVAGVTGWVEQGLIDFGTNPVLRSLIIDGIFAGVGSVLSFLPIIVVLFFFLSILEDSGYMARVAFIMDGLLRKIGLSGRSFVPMLIGFGCSVPAIMATRTLSSERDRKMTILLTPFMSCSAKLPIYALFTAAFFPQHGALVMILLYIIGMVLAVVIGLILKDTLFGGKPVPFVMELPSYRLPSPKSVALLIWDKAKDFITRAFTVIFVASIAIWILQTFDIRFNLVTDSAASMLASIGRTIAPVFAPLGFGDWRAATALITGFTMKEAVVSTFAVLTGGELSVALSAIFTPLTAFVFLIFTLLYTPCVAAIAAVKREMHSGLAALAVAAFQCAIAWLVAFGVFQMGILLGL